MAILSEQPAPSGDSYAFAANALVIAEPGAGAQAATDALALAGIRASCVVGFADAPLQLAAQVSVDMILIEAVGAPDALLDVVLARADATAREHGAAVVAAIAEDQIDLAAAHLLGSDCHLLCVPSMAERVAALALARGGLTPRLHDASRDAETARLQRLNEEVARIAETLARLTRGEEDERRNGVRAPGQDYRGPSDGDAPEASAQEIRAAIRSRRLRAQFFAGELFADPAWDMLLDLFAAELEQTRVSVSSLCIAAAVPPTTALRWIGTLHDAGLFERHADPADRRRAYIALSAKGLAGMRSYIAAAKRQGLSIA
jgi:hypothetical protein